MIAILLGSGLKKAGNKVCFQRALYRKIHSFSLCPPHRTANACKLSGHVLPLYRFSALL